jgi:hypothetical protein
VSFLSALYSPPGMHSLVWATHTRRAVYENYQPKL